MEINNGLAFVALVIIIADFIGLLFFFHCVRKNKYKVGDYVYMMPDGCHLELAKIIFIEWHIHYDDIVSGPTYYIDFVEGEHKGLSRDDVAENEILCKFKGERLVLSE